MRAQGHVEQECRPELPADGLLAVTQEVAELEGLFDLLEEHFDAPARLIEVAYAAGTPFEIVGDEECQQLMRDFIAANPALWNEDIGES